MTLLEQIRDFYANDPKRWTQGYFAKSNRGEDVNYNDPDASCWCLLGSTFKCNRGQFYLPMVQLHSLKILAQAFRELGFTEHYSISHINDQENMTFEKVMAALDRAIELEKKQ